MQYIRLRPEGGCGICGYIWQVLRGIYHQSNEKFYIDFDTCIYKDSERQESNVWDYYFEQPDFKSDPGIENAKEIVGIIDVPESEFRFNYLHNPTEETIQKIRDNYSKIISRYLIPREDIKAEINGFIENNFKGKRVLGIHLRGTDHPDKKEMKEYMPTIKALATKYDIIFVAADEDYRYKFVKAVFGEKVIAYSSIKSTDASPLHHGKSGPGYQYAIGRDVIVEAFLLANTNFLCCFSNSNVNFLSRCINPKLPYIAI